jgi:hypothetical protein
VDPSASTAESDRVERAFRHLPLDQRTVLVLQHYGSLTHTEIAATLGIPVGTVKSRVRYGVAAMRAALEADDRSTAMPAGLRSGDAGDILVAAGSVWVVDGCSNAVLRLPVGAFGP